MRREPGNEAWEELEAHQRNNFRAFFDFKKIDVHYLVENGGLFKIGRA